MLMKAKSSLISPDEESFSALVASITDYAIFVLDSDGIVASWNSGAERIKGYGAREIIGQDYAVFFTPEDRATGVPAEGLRAARTAGRFRCEGWRLRKDGCRYWASVVLIALRKPDGDVRGYLKVTRDMTERRRAEERLRESEERLQAFMNFSPSVMFIKDSAGCYLHANDEFLQRFDLHRDQVIGATDLAIFPQAQAERFIANDARVFAHGAAIRFEEAAQYRDGEHVSLVNKFPIRDGQGQIVAIGGIVTDITDRKKMERELSEAAARLREISRRLVETQESERRKLARELHDRVGQNLTALNINLNIIMNLLPADAAGSARLRGRLSEALRLLESTAHCIEDVMSDLHPPMLRSFGLVAALHWYAGLFAKRTIIDAKVSGNEVLPRLTLDCEMAMFRIAQESMNNVVKHAHATRIKIEFRSGPGYAVMTIADNGVGFDPALLASPVDQPRWGMMGLHERAQSVGGHLRVETAPGQGTRIIVEIKR